MLSGLLQRIDAALEADSAEFATASNVPQTTVDDDGEVEFDFGPSLET